MQQGVNRFIGSYALGLKNRSGLSDPGSVDLSINRLSMVSDTLTVTFRIRPHSDRDCLRAGCLPELAYVREMDEVSRCLQASSRY